MLQLYLPIAEMSVNILTLIALGGLVGVLSGMFGVGGGFLTTPFFIFIGVPPTVAVATSANQIVASSFSGFLAHWRRRNVDIKMGNLLLVGGLVGSTLGVWLFKWLEALGQIDLVISLSYVVFLSAIGILMAIESGRAIVKRKKPTNNSHKRHNAMQRLPWRTRFRRSGLYISIWLPLGIGFGVGVMVSIMGIGGGFFIIPAMIYIIGMPTSVVVGTSLYQTMFITANVTLLHAITTQTVDILLATIVLTASVIGAQIGSRWGTKVAPEKLRAMLALIVLSVALKLGYGLLITPDDLYTLEALGAE